MSGNIEGATGQNDKDLSPKLINDLSEVPQENRVDLKKISDSIKFDVCNLAKENLRFLEPIQVEFDHSEGGGGCRIFGKGPFCPHLMIGVSGIECIAGDSKGGNLEMHMSHSIAGGKLSKSAVGKLIDAVFKSEKPTLKRLVNYSECNMNHLVVKFDNLTKLMDAVVQPNSGAPPPTGPRGTMK